VCVCVPIHRLCIDTRFGKVCKAAVKRQTTLGNIYSSIRLDKQLGEVYILWDYNIYIYIRIPLKRLII
jgi:hypothetical protein